MKQILKSATDKQVVFASAVTTLPFPPLVCGYVDDVWNIGDAVWPEFDIEIWAAATVNLTLAELWKGKLHPLVVADAVFTAANATDLFTKAAHGLRNGDGPVFPVNAGGALPTGLTVGEGYYVVLVDANTFRLATTRKNALAGTYVNITTDGTGTQTLQDSADTKRVHWHSMGLLGNYGDGAIALAEQKAYTARCKHDPKAIAYTISATLSAAVATSGMGTPIVEEE